MDETEFWETIDSTRAAADGDPEDHADLLTERLAQLDPELVLEFARYFETRYNRAYRWDLWGAAVVLLRPESDADSFDYFRCWLIGQGREIFEGALQDPDALADLLDDFDEEIDGDGEELGYAADEAYEQLTGAPTPPIWAFPPQAADPEGAAGRLRRRARSPSGIPACGSGSARPEPGEVGPAVDAHRRRRDVAAVVAGQHRDHGGVTSAGSPIPLPMTATSW